MNIEKHIYNVKNSLDKAQEKLNADDYDTALAIFVAVWTNFQELIDGVLELKALAALAERPAGESSGGP